MLMVIVVQPHLLFQTVEVRFPLDTGIVVQLALLLESWDVFSFDGAVVVAVIRQYPLDLIGRLPVGGPRW